MMQSLYQSVFPNEKNVIAAFSNKEGASPKSPYDNHQVFQSLNLAEYPKVWPVQVHGNDVSVIHSHSSLSDSKENLILPDTDGMITNQKNLVLTTVHADCLAVFFYDPIQRAIGLVHAGWRGSAKGIAEKAVQKMVQEFHSKPSDIKAHISPGISHCCFETGPEVLSTFLEGYSWADQYATKQGEKYYLDLKKINARQLSDLGLYDITIDSDCTCCKSDVYCSYRKEAGTTRRMGAIITMI